MERWEPLVKEFEPLQLLDHELRLPQELRCLEPVCVHLAVDRWKLRTTVDHRSEAWEPWRWSAEREPRKWCWLRPEPPEPRPPTCLHHVELLDVEKRTTPEPQAVPVSWRSCQWSTAWHT